MAKVDADKLKARYEKARQDWQAHQKRERERRKKQRVREDTERKIVAGEFVLSLLDSGEYDSARFMSRLDTYLDDTRRRALFGLPPRDEAPQTAAQDATNTPLEESPAAP